MKEINGTKYYSKAEAIAMLGCSLNTLNKKVSQMHLTGFRFGRTMHYTEAQIAQILEYQAHNQNTNL